MDISPSNFVSVDIILADVLDIVDDSSTKMKSKGWYVSHIQQALEELSFDTFFSEVTQSFQVPLNLRLEMPKGSFNLREVYLFNGSKCVIENSKKVWRKRNFINAESGKGYVAHDKWENKNDPFYASRGNHNQNDPNRTSASPNNVFFYGIQDGLIMFSESCLSHKNVLLVYNGIMADIGEVPIVPQFFRQAVKDWVAVKALEIRRNQSVGTAYYNHWGTMLREYKDSLDKPYDGSWAKAEHRAKQLNAGERSDIKEYMTSLNY